MPLARAWYKGGEAFRDDVKRDAMSAAVVVSVADDASYSDGNVSSRAQVNFCCLDIYIYI